MSSKVKISLPVKPEDFLSAIRLFQQNMRLSFNPYRDANATPAQASMILTIEQHQPLNLQKLAGLLRLDKSTVSQSLSQLAHRGWIRMSENLNDRRNKIIELTPSGELTAHQVMLAEEKSMAELLKAFTEAEKNAAFYGLHLLNQALSPVLNQPTTEELRTPITHEKPSEVSV